jgi:hypothetical protein
MNMNLIKGELGRLGVPDLFRAIAAESRSGRLTLSSNRGTQGVIHFRAGVIYDVRIEPRVSRLPRRLISAGLATREDLQDAKRNAGGNGGHLGEIVVGAGLLRRSQLEALVREEFADDVFELIQWNQGTFVFDPDGTTDGDLGVELNVDELLTESERRLHEWRQIGRRIKSLTDVAILESADDGPPEVALTPEEWALVSRVDGELSIKDLSDSCGFSILEGARCAFGLVTSGLISVRRDFDSDGAAPVLEEMSLPESVKTPTEGRLVDLVVEAGGYVEGMEEQVDVLESMAEMELQASAEPEVEPEPVIEQAAVEADLEPVEFEVEADLPAPPPETEESPSEVIAQPIEVEPETFVEEPEVVSVELDPEPVAEEEVPLEVEWPEPEPEPVSISDGVETEPVEPESAESEPPQVEGLEPVADETVPLEVEWREPEAEEVEAEEVEAEELPELVADVELPPVPDTVPESFSEPAPQPEPTPEPEPVQVEARDEAPTVEVDSIVESPAEPEVEQEIEHREIEAESVKSVARITMPDPDQSGVYLEPAGAFFTSLWEGVDGDETPEHKETVIVAEERPRPAERTVVESMTSEFADLARSLDEDLDVVSVQHAEPTSLPPGSEPKELFSYFGPRQVDPSVDTSALVREFSAIGREEEEAPDPEPPPPKRADSKRSGRFGRRKPK